MIKTIKITNHLKESIELELTRPDKSGIYIQEITGLGPPTAHINTTEVATNDGSIFNSSRVTTRNIVLTLGFLFKPDIETVRQLSYKYFPIKKQVKLKITTDNRVGEVYGYVESNEPNIFSERQTTQISLICPDPFIYAEGTNTTIFSGVESAFEFPFSNESLTEDLIIMGNMTTGTTKSIFYSGDSEIGVTIHIYASGLVSNITIYDPITNRKMEIDVDRIQAITGSPIIEGDEITISSVRGNKYITLTRVGVEYNILNSLNRDVYWFQLFKGPNIFSYYAESGLSNINFIIENKTIYEGV